MRVQDLKGEAKELFEQWRALGYTERQASGPRAAVGLVREPELYEGFGGFFGFEPGGGECGCAGSRPGGAC